MNKSEISNKLLFILFLIFINYNTYSQSKDVDYKKVVYTKTTFLFSYFNNYTGLPNIDSIIYKSIQNNCFKHPSPINLENILSETTISPDSFNYYLKYKYRTFKKDKHLEFQLLGILKNPDKTQIFYSPAFGWNNYNKAMLGMIIYNDFLPFNKLTYYIMPLYAFGNNDIAGNAYLNYGIYPYSSPFQSINISISGNQYALNKTRNTNFQKIKGEVNILLNNQNYNSRIENRIIINSIAATDLIDKLAFDKNDYNYFFNLNYLHKNKKHVNPYSVILNIESNKDYVKSQVVAKYKFSYNNTNKGFDIRLFGGKFLYNNNNFGLSNYRLTGSTGINDYMYENIFLGRIESYLNNNNLNKQFVNSDGGFAIYAPLQSNDWMMALNFKTSIPGIIPLKLYANFGTYKGAGNDLIGLKLIPYEIGVELHLISDIFVVYFPIKTSDDLKMINDIYTDIYFEKIRVTLNINLLNPFVNIKNLSFIEN